MTEACSGIGELSFFSKKVRLMNMGKELMYKVEMLPRDFDMETGKSEEFLHITRIPINELESEPIVIEIVR